MYHELSKILNLPITGGFYVLPFQGFNQNEIYMELRAVQLFYQSFED